MVHLYIWFIQFLILYKEDTKTIIVIITINILTIKKYKDLERLKEVYVNIGII